MTPATASTAASSAPTSTPQAVKDTLASLSQTLSSDEKMQIDLALRNSLKDLASMKQSMFTPDGKHIDELRTSRRLFHQSEKRSRQQQAAELSATKKKTKQGSPSPIPGGLIMIDHTPPSTKNRIHNNGLDRAYFEHTQTQTSEYNLQRQSDTNKWNKWNQEVRNEIIRNIRVAKDEVTKEKARQLYRVFTRHQPPTLYADVHNIAMDCNSSGMLVAETVEMMMSMLTDEN